MAQMFKRLNAAFKKLFFALATLGNSLNGANTLYFSQCIHHM